MKSLFIQNSLSQVTILDRSNQPYHIPADSKLAIKSSSFKVQYPFTFLTLLTVTSQWSINIRAGDKSDINRITEKVILEAGTYTLPNLVNVVNNNTRGMTIEILRNGNVKVHIKDGLQMKPSIDDFYKVLGIGVAPGWWSGPGNLYGRPVIPDQTHLNLVCDELDDEMNYLDGKPSKIFHSFSLFSHETYIDQYFENPVFKSITGGTDELHFRFENKTDIKITDIMIEVLIQ